jgi:uncharacterized protein (DUF58 family)
MEIIIIISILLIAVLVALYMAMVYGKDKSQSIVLPNSNTNTLDLLKEVKRIELSSKQTSKDLFSGSYHSTFKGKGMSFSEVRAYNYGDDVRSIDWNVTARNDSPFIKVFEEERELTLMLMIDISRSSFFGTSQFLKKDVITKISALLSMSAIQNNDKVGVLFFSDKIEKYIPPKKGKSHILRIIHDFINIQPSGESNDTDINGALKYINNMLKKRSILFLISDFIDSKSYEDSLRIAKKKHDIRGIMVYDQKEQTIPNVGLVNTIDIESGERKWIDTSNTANRKSYEDWFKSNAEKAKHTFNKSGVELISIETMQNYTMAILKSFKKSR